MRRRTSVLSSSYLENTFQFVQESSGLRVQAVGSVTAVSAEQSLLSLVISEAATALVQDLRDSDRDLSAVPSSPEAGMAHCHRTSSQDQLSSTNLCIVLIHPRYLENLSCLPY